MRSAGVPAARGIRMLGRTDASLLGLGTQMLSEVAAGILLGLAADHLLGTTNRWIVVGSIVGVVVAMWTVIRTAIRLGRRNATGHAARGKGTAESGPGADRGAAR